MVWNSWCFRGCKKSHRQSILSKRFAWFIHFVAFDVCWWIRESHWRECVSAAIEIGKRDRVFEDDVFIENTCLGIGSKKRGTKFKRGRSFNQVTWFSWPMVSRDWIFASVRHLCCGNKWHTAHFKFWEYKSYNLLISEAYHRYFCAEVALQPLDHFEFTIYGFLFCSPMVRKTWVQSQFESF